ncbi:membrane-binding protein [Methanolobus sp. WCC4]|uniref:membrane-binding protein n=1 Tax=Methanolobus sp. WCC4 TaxID=3125784 RepID=UPI0030F554C7
MNRKIVVFIMLLVLSLAVSGCSDKETTTTIESEDGEEYEVTYTEGDVGDEECPVGSSWTASNPSTGEIMTMEIVGREEIEGIEMCHAVYEANVIGEDNVARVDYYWSDEEEDGAFMFIAYDEDGNIVSEMKAMNGKMTITGEDGETIEMDIPQDE